MLFRSEREVNTIDPPLVNKLPKWSEVTISFEKGDCPIPSTRPGRYPIGALTFASVRVWFRTAWLLVAYGQDLLRTIGLRFLTLCLVLRLLALFLLLFATFTWLSSSIVFSIDGIVPLDCLRGSRISIGHLEEFSDGGRRV